MSWIDQLKERVGSRMAICKECPYYISLTKQCKKCGCVLPAKTAIAGQQCPINKW